MTFSLSAHILPVPFICGCFLAFYLAFKARSLSLPPGPRGSIFIGVKRLLPPSEPWKTYLEWSRRYNNTVISFPVYNRQVVVLNSGKAVHELLDKRANIYSDRPKSWMFHELCDRKNSVFNVSSIDQRHRLYRKVLQTGLSSRATQQYWPLLESEMAVLLHGFSETPEQYEAHIRRNAAAVIMKVAYGYTVSQQDDFFIGLAEESSKISGWATAPGRWLVDYYPMLRFVPSSFPGAGFKRQGEAWRRRLDALSSVPHEWVKKQMASGKYIESFTSRLLHPEGGIHVGAAEEDAIKWCAGGLYAGAADTTVSGLLSFILLMALNPEVQERAQAEIDEHTEVDRLPHPSELGQLKYLGAVMKEILRFAPIAPLALPHKVIQDDEYEGHRIPKGATVMANVWAITRDDHEYPNPSVFNPSRFLPSKTNPQVQSDPRLYSFGFGRRTCPGSQFAETSMLFAMASILTNFTIVSLAQSRLVRPVPELEMTTGITSHIKPFDIKIIPRARRDQ